MKILKLSQVPENCEFVAQLGGTRRLWPSFGATAQRKHNIYVARRVYNDNSACFVYENACVARENQ